MHKKQFLLRAVTLLILAGLVFAGCATEAERTVDPSIRIAEVYESNVIRMRVSLFPDNIDDFEFSVEPDTHTVTDVRRANQFIYLTLDQAMETGQSYRVSFTSEAYEVSGSADVDTAPLYEAIFNEMYSDKPLGYNLEDGVSTFRLFVPRGVAVELHVFDDLDQEEGTVYQMENDGDQVFEAFIDGEMWGKYYGYRITERSYEPRRFHPHIDHDTIFHDPYSWAVATHNEFPSKLRTLIIDPSGYDWEGTEPLQIDIRDLVIMEAHIRDLTAHPTAEADVPGYRGMLTAQRGGIEYLKHLGVNAVEFLPIHEFNNIEAPWQESSHGFLNNWNATEENYWGYMTTNFFAPESYFASDGTLERGTWKGTDGRAINEFRDVVRELHKNGIAVLLDVVYNHTSQYDEQPLKLIDYDFYFKPQDRTGTGNEVDTRRRMVRRMVLDSLEHWMTEYHIDGFRFDLAASHDRKTIEAIYDEMRQINPEVYLIAEPWGGEGLTNANDFIEVGWSKWESGIRDAVRGQNRPADSSARNFALGDTSANGLVPFWGATQQGQPYQHVNYIESHDDATLGDNFRIASGFYSFENPDGSINRIEDIQEYLTNTPDLQAAHEIAALSLFLSQGPVMLHLGQEWARGKVVPDLTGEVDEVTDRGRIGTASDNIVFNTPTPNSYMLDNETNWINFDHVEFNRPLVDFYRGLIELRIAEPLLGRAESDQIDLLRDSSNRYALGTNIDGQIIGFVNADRDNTATFSVPQGTYSVVVEGSSAGTEELREFTGSEITIPEASGLIMIRK
ncbi:alpha-amylase family glycosyl hydrolase [Spirochaeta africana]|uniref:Pullulanase-like glycosidase possibly secreted by type II secretory pathway n=1 Tax=Spirochaeta africana (strain ATCC 700263 / DSM 8902 / Z-7692) TaxID=889378 RepID=H9UKQ3_SPIAZ|nr:alpha-amylase family glycosyl hydrolase [Spirochaeta africana]AFG38096.1 pullulanase-like glycosidase possibly secreted by type II secretory pathway [Spirochaeta africana DSM 8902]